MNFGIVSLLGNIVGAELRIILTLIFIVVIDVFLSFLQFCILQTSEGWQMPGLPLPLLPGFYDYRARY
jgi:hypothetical protein